MSDATYDLFADEADAPAVPPRSTLYHCPVIDEGTWMQESLLNYLHRLAREHQIRVMDLLVQVVLPRTNVSIHYGRFRFATESARTVNGYGKYASQVSTALMDLTCVTNLQSSTFLPWSGLFDGKGAGLLHPTRTWCPDCLAEAELAGEPHNFPLLWSCSSVTHCPIHMCELQSLCVKCNAPQQPVCDSAFYGRCLSCGMSLGWKSGLFTSHRLSNRQHFITKGLGAMIAMGPRALELASTERFSAGIRRIAEITHNGSCRRLAKSLKITPKVMVDWVRLSKRPRMDTFLEVCYRLGIDPVDLLQGYLPSSEPRIRPGSLPLSRPSHKLPPERLRAVETEIHRIVFNDGHPTPLADLARTFGTSPGHLRYQLPDACECLLTYNATVGQRISQAKREERMRRAKLIVQDLFAQQTHLPRRRVATALAAQGLNIRCPDTRRAAYDEIHRLNEELLAQLEEQRSRQYKVSNRE
jgi:TniQ